MGAKKSLQMSTKRLQISKANSKIVISVAVASALLAFSLVASNALWQKRSYQSKVIKEQEQAKAQLEENIENVDELKSKYSEFVNRPENIIGGNSEGDSDNDGDNGKIVLDALPGKYDFPALISSIEKILVDRNYNIDSISGDDVPPDSGDHEDSDDDEESSGSSSESESPVEMPFELSAQGSWTRMIALLRDFKKSIRPIIIDTANFNAQSDGQDTTVQMSVEAKSFYQPEKNLEVNYKVVK